MTLNSNFSKNVTHSSASTEVEAQKPSLWDLEEKVFMVLKNEIELKI